MERGTPRSSRNSGCISDVCDDLPKIKGIDESISESASFDASIFSFRNYFLIGENHVVVGFAVSKKSIVSRLVVEEDYSRIADSVSFRSKRDSDCYPSF